MKSNQETHIFRKAPVVMPWQAVIPSLIRPNYTILTHPEWYFTAQVLPAMLVWLLVYYSANPGEVEWRLFFRNYFIPLPWNDNVLDNYFSLGHEENFWGLNVDLLC